MKRISIYLGLIAGLMSVNQSFAQKCLSDMMRDEFFKQNPEALKEHKSFYENLQPFDNSKRAGKLIIPVVFHVIHTNGPENISKAQIEDQIRILNLDYNKSNANISSVRSIFTGVVSDMQLEFQLAKIDPNGNCTDGINRVYSTLHVNADDAVKSVSYWPYNKYLNIWIVSSINSNGAQGTVLGYAQFPSVSTFAPSKDGVVCRSDYVGSIGTSDANKAGRVLTHEIGHWLGLLHPFQDDCNGGDNCDDTPPVSGQFTNASCNPAVNSCHNDNPDLPDQFENFMDYSEGRCQAMFTIDQKTISRNVLETKYTFRKNLWSSSNLIATGISDGTGAPQAYFSSDKRTVCIGEPVTFYDESCKSLPTSRQWTFNGASVVSTNIENPTITYMQTGKYKVTLTVSNSNGNNTKEIDSYIEVRPAVANIKSGVMQGFENADFEAAEGWYIRKDAPKAWQINTSVAYGGSKSLYIAIDSNTAWGQRFQFETAPVDLRPFKNMNPKLSYMIAYARRNTVNFERLKVFASTDCGSTWTQYFVQQSGALASVTGLQYQFIPSKPSDWKRISNSLAAFENDSNIMFRFEVESGSGNPVFIDNINISQFYTGIGDVELKDGITIYPNPSSGDVTIRVELDEQDAAFGIELYDLMGNLIRTVANSPADSGTQEFRLQKENLAAGIYIVKVKVRGQTVSKKLVVSH